MLRDSRNVPFPPDEYAHNCMQMKIPAAPQVEVWEAGYRKGMTCEHRTSMQNSILIAVSILFGCNVADVVQALQKSRYLKRCRYLYSRNDSRLVMELENVVQKGIF
jgi:hypothetical protein